MRSRFSLFVDAIILFLALWLLFFAWIRFYAKTVAISALAGATLSGLIVYLVFFLGYKRNLKINLSKTEKKNAQTLALNLNFTPISQVLEFFSACLDKDYQISEICANSLVLTPNSAQNSAHSTMHSTLFVPFYENKKFALSHLSTVFKLAKAKGISEVIICADEVESDVKIFTKQLNGWKFSFMDTLEFYGQYAKDKSPLPAVLDVDKPKLQRKEIIAYALNPARARHYLLFGFLLLATSFIVPFKIYYLLWGSLMCVIALLIKVIPILKKE
ncbi:MAG: hypothetical protein IJ301_01160 [Clostridia bacterium]|nr:hypothetical protein [Clostridia bacterium]